MYYIIFNKKANLKKSGNVPSKI